MNKKTAVAVLGMAGLALLLTGCAGLFQNPAPKEAAPIAPGNPAEVATVDPRLLGEGMIQPGQDYTPDRIIVAHTDNADGRAALAEVMEHVGDRIVDSVVLGEIVIVAIDLKPGLDVPEALGMVALLIRDGFDPVPVGGAPTRPTRRPPRVAGIVFAEPDYIFELPTPVPPPVDVKAVEPKIYDPAADLRPFQWALDALQAESAWATGFTGAGIVVAVLDTGVDSTHPDLVGQVTHHVDPRPVVPSVLPPPRNFDPHSGHGTHCAAIIAAKNDARGIVGLAYNAKIMDIRIFVHPDPALVPTPPPPPPFIGVLPTARGIKWAVDNGAHVLSNSWGGVTYSQVLKAAYDYALARGVTVVASAGNSFDTVWFRPASIAGVIAVGATTPHDRKVDFSTMGSWLSVSAPGERVLSAVHSGIMQPGTGVPLLYDYLSGTSMSGPYVSALAAMILERDLAASPYQVKRLVERTAKDLEAPGFDIRTGWGLIQPTRALIAPLPPNTGAALRIHVVTASSMPLRGAWRPVPYMDITLRKGGRIIERGQTDLEGWVNLGFPTGDHPPGGPGLGYFPVLEPGTYEIIVGGDDATWPLPWTRTANRVTARTTVMLTAGGTTTVVVPVTTTLEVTMSWTGGGADTNIDLAVGEPGIGWTRAAAPGPSGTWTADAAPGATGTETYTLNPIHGDDALYPLAVVLNSGAPATVTVTVRQNTIVETYTFGLTVPGWYPAFSPPVTRWPGWWNNVAGPWVY